MTFSITATPAVTAGPNGESPASVIVDIATTEVITRITRTDSYGVYDLIPDKATVIAGNYPGLGATIVTRKNLANNPSFETNTSFWTPTFSAGTTTRFASTAFAGQSGTMLGQVASDGTSSLAGLRTSPFAVGAGKWLAVKAFIANDQNNESMVRLYAAPGGQIAGQYSINGFYPGATQTVIAQVLTTFTTVYVEALVRRQTGFLGNGHRLWVDSVMYNIFDTEAEAVAYAAKPFFSGSTPAAGLIKYRWTGTAEGSSSEEYFSGWRVTDDAAPFETVTYTAYTAGGTQSVTVNNDRPEMPVMLTTLTGGAAWIIAEQITTYNGRRDSGAIHHDTGGEFPVVTYGTRKLRTGTLGIYCPSHADALKVEAVLTDHVALIRQHVPGLDLAISVLNTEVSPHEGQSERTRWNVNAEFAEVKYSPVWSLT